MEPPTPCAASAQDMLLDIVSCDPKQLRVQGLWAAALRYMLFGILAAISYAVRS